MLGGEGLERYVEWRGWKGWRQWKCGMGLMQYEV